MSATLTEAPKVEDLVTIEVDGRPLQARKGAMLIDVTDAEGIYIPRFCYHKKLSVAANCRMCLVEVERAPKPQPACATPVMEGMKVFTRSAKAVSGQQATMEFLLINHPLDCPICDQGGECELQDLALGYGSAVSQFTEGKRVVRDKNIGPLVQTDMTRCIHCTRCVRFGEEIAGLRELGATGRGEHVEIGTYVAQAMTSELSGNVIDLCPVGALTSKPYRYSARAWELRQSDTIAPHDCVGSNVHAHVKGQVVKRIVPRENEATNETWISDRDRFSYQGLGSPDRLLTPRIREAGQWRECDWETALNTAVAALQKSGSGLSALASPSSTCEEFFLLQRLVRGFGSQQIEHRLRQVDFSADSNEPLFPALGGSLAELERADAVIIVGGYPRHDQPLINHRVRKAALRGVPVIVIDTLAQDYNFELADRLTVAPSRLSAALGGLLRACADASGKPDPTAGQYAVDPATVEIAQRLQGCQRIHVLVGSRVHMDPQRGVLLGLLGALCALYPAQLSLLMEGANAAGAWLAGAVPHRGPAGRALATVETHPKPAASTYLLLGIEPSADCADPVAMRSALQRADCVVALTAYATPELDSLATLMLPIAAFAENEGSYLNGAGEWQAFGAAVKPPGVARAAWKVLRAIGAQCQLAGFDAVGCEEVARELHDACDTLAPMPAAYQLLPSTAEDVVGANTLERITQVPMYRVDALVRRAPALQQMPQAGDELVHVSPRTLERLGLADGARITVEVGEVKVATSVQMDAVVPDGCCLIYAATALAAGLPASVSVTLVAAGGRGD